MAFTLECKYACISLPLLCFLFWINIQYFFTLDSYHANLAGQMKVLNLLYVCNIHN